MRSLDDAIHPVGAMQLAMGDAEERGNARKIERCLRK